MPTVMDREISDVAIIEASRHDTDRFGLLHDRYCAMPYRYAYRRLGPSGSAEDVVADAFVVAFRKRNRYDLSKADARPWLFGILTREVARRRRSEEARYRAIDRAGARDEASAEEFADRVVAAVSAQAGSPEELEPGVGTDLTPGLTGCYLTPSWFGRVRDMRDYGLTAIRPGPIGISSSRAPVSSTNSSTARRAPW